MEPLHLESMQTRCFFNVNSDVCRVATIQRINNKMIESVILLFKSASPRLAVPNLRNNGCYTHLMFFILFSSVSLCLCGERF